MLDHAGTGIRIRPTGAALGADVEGVDLAQPLRR